MPYEKFADGTRKDLSEEIPFELPRGWAWTRVKYVTSIKRDEYVTRKQIREGKIPVILGGQEPAYYCDKSNHDGPCVVVSRSGASAGFASYWDEPIFVTDGFLFECVNGLTARYFYHWLKSFPFVKLQRGTGMPHVQSEVLNALLFPLPPLAEQKRIVAKVEELFAYADKIGETSKGIATTAQRIDKKILDLAIRGQLVAQDPTDEPASELLKRIRETKKVGRSPRDRRAAESFIFRGSDRLAYETVGGKTRCIQDEIPFDIPDSWEWARLGNVLMPMETKLPQGESFDYIDIDAIDNKHNVVLSPKHLATSKAPSRASRGLKTGDSLFSVVRPYLRNIAYIDESLSDCIASTGFYVCRPCEIDPRFLFRLLPSDYVVNGVNAFMKGDNSPSVRAAHIQNLLVPIPPLAEQKRIVAKIEQLKSMTAALKIP